MLETLQLSAFGAFHTVISIVAVAAGAVALVRDKVIVPTNAVGKTYIVTTVLTCVTGFGIFHHGGFGKPHALGIITLVVLGVAAASRKTALFGRASRTVEAISYLATFFFHMIPTITETATRFPLGSPLVTDRDGPELQAAAGVVVVALVIAAVLQARWLRREGRGS